LLTFKPISEFIKGPRENNIADQGCRESEKMVVKH